MNKQSQWLFESPPAPEATHYNNGYATSSEYYNPELESEWEQESSNPSLGEEEWEVKSPRRHVPSPPFFPPRSKRNRLSPRFPRARAFIAKRAAAQLPAREMTQEFAEPPRRYFYWDAWWLNPSTGQYELLEARGPIYTVREDGEKIRSTLLIKWQVQRRGTILARCFVWNGEKWFLCKDYSF